METQIRQGDILFTLVDALPALDLEASESDIVAEGEVTGHAHRLVDGVVYTNALGAMYLQCIKAGQVVHEEHKTVSLPAGVWQVTRQREYTPEETRMVWD